MLLLYLHAALEACLARMNGHDATVSRNADRRRLLPRAFLDGGAKGHGDTLGDGPAPEVRRLLEGRLAQRLFPSANPSTRLPEAIAKRLRVSHVRHVARQLDSNLVVQRLERAISTNP